MHDRGRVPGSFFRRVGGLCHDAATLRGRVWPICARARSLRCGFQLEEPLAIRSQQLADDGRAHAFEADDVDAELARLIHDLRRSDRCASGAERPAASRIERLEADLAASRHMDEAAALASRLRDADMLYAAADLFGSRI